MRQQKHFSLLVVCLVAVLPGLCQTKIDLLTQTKGSLDVSAAPATRPMKTGTTLPATCQVGEMFFKSDAAAGLNLYGCTAANTWRAQSSSGGGAVTLAGDVTGSSSATTVGAIRNKTISTAQPSNGQVLAWNGTLGVWEPQTVTSGGGGSTNAVQLQGRDVSATAPGDGQVLAWSSSVNQWRPASVTSGGGGSSSSPAPFEVVRSSATTLQIGGSCSISSPCNVRFGNTTYRFEGPATVTITGGAGSAFIYISAMGVLTVGHNVTASCSSCSAVSGVVAFPPDSVPLFTWSAAAGQWDTTGGLDWRALISGKNITAGIGLVNAEAGGATMLSVDTAVVGLRVAVPATATGSCTSGSWAADASFYYQCVQANTWRRAGLSSW